MSSGASTDLRAARRGGSLHRYGASPGTLVARLVGRRAALQGVIWGAVFGLYVFSSASGFAHSYPTVASRLTAARSLGSNTGLQALLGRPRQIDTVAGFTAWRSLGVLTLVGAIWGLLAGTKLLRGEEEAGRWELLLAGQTTRRRAVSQGLAGLAAGWACLWVSTALLTLAVVRSTHPAISPSAALFFSIAVTSSAGVFLAVGALASQLTITRRRAAMIAAGAFGVAFLIRMVADSGSHLGWAVWVSPLGWVEQTHPLTGSRPIILAPIIALVVVLVALTVRLGAVRDLGAGAVPERDTAPARTRLLANAAGLAVRLVRPVAIGWIAALAAAGLLFGLVAQSAAQAESGSATVQQAISRLGGRHGGADAYLGITFLISATLIALVAAGQVLTSREEEAYGRLDNLLVRPAGRLSWLIGRLVIAATLVLICGVVAGVLAWAGAASQHTGVRFPSLLEAGLNTVPPAVCLLGLGTLVHATAPRLTAVATYGLVAWSFLVEFIGSIIQANHWLLDTSLLYHLAPAPASDPNWASGAGLVGLGLVAAAVGGLAFTRRDLASA